MMNNLSNILQPVEFIKIHEIKDKAIDKRRSMINTPGITDALLPEEKMIFIASTKKQILEFDDNIFVEKLWKLLEWIAHDVGIRQKIDVYDATRITDILKTHYSTFTLSEIKIAFELALVGSLDGYLPDDRNGFPDKNHYQIFNIEYLTKILNAYEKYQKKVFLKLYEIIPKTISNVSIEEKDCYQNEINNRIYQCFLKYKYCHEFDLNFLDEMFIYDFLLSVGLSKEVEVSENDKKIALTEILTKIRIGLIKAFRAECIRHQGIKSDEIQHSAYIIAKNREIRNTFDFIINEEIQLTDYLCYQRNFLKK